MERTVTVIDSVLPNTKDLQKRLALAEAQKAADAARRAAAVEADKKVLLEGLSKPMGVSDEEHLRRAAAIVERGVRNGQTEVFILRFPHELCTDRGRAINQAEPGWEKTLTGQPQELYAFWERYLRPRGYRLKVQVIDFPGGMPGDIGITLCWA
jgi:hypothetical protein